MVAGDRPGDRPGTKPGAAQNAAPGADVEAAYFDELVGAQGEFNPLADSGWATLARRFAELARPRPGSRVLDIGCGTGQSRQIYAPWVASDSASYIGVDLSEAALALARARYPADRWERADARALPYADASFDLVAFSSVLHHIPDFEAALVEARRVLVPGGRVFAFDPNLLHPAMALFRHPRSPLYSPKGVSPNEAPLLPRRLREAFLGAGFVELRQRAQSDIAYREVAPRLINALLGAYNIADRWFERIGLGRWFGTFVLTAGTKPETGP
jgi:SAM-dependent methyltransferase